MGKKNFKSGLDSLLGVREAEPVHVPQRIRESIEQPVAAGAAKRGRPRTNFREIEKSSQEGCKSTETRATFIVKEADLEKVKALAYWERLQIKDVVEAALREYVERYEKKEGKPLKPVPKR